MLIFKRKKINKSVGIFSHSYLSKHFLLWSLSVFVFFMGSSVDLEPIYFHCKNKISSSKSSSYKRSSKHMHNIPAEGLIWKFSIVEPKLFFSAHQTPAAFPAVTSTIKALTHTNLNIRLALDPVTISHGGQRNHFPSRLRTPIKRPIKNSAYITFTTKICLQ